MLLYVVLYLKPYKRSLDIGTQYGCTRSNKNENQVSIMDHEQMNL